MLMSVVMLTLSIKTEAGPPEVLGAIALVKRCRLTLSNPRWNRLELSA
jgi:hypothetical protein